MSERKTLLFVTVAKPLHPAENARLRELLAQVAKAAPGYVFLVLPPGIKVQTADFLPEVDDEILAAAGLVRRPALPSAAYKPHPASNLGTRLDKNQTIAVPRQASGLL